MNGRGGGIEEKAGLRKAGRGEQGGLQISGKEMEEEVTR